MKKIFVLICVLLFVKFYNQSFDHLFNCEFDKAIESLEKTQELNPDNPAIYWQLTFAFWFKVEHDKNLKKEDRKEIKKKFNQAFDRGVALCDPDSVDSEILFYLGGLYGNKVFFKQAMGEKNISLLENTNKSREWLEKIKETEDFYYEACGYLGIFNYGPIIVPKFVMWLAKKRGYKYDKERGLQQIKDAIKYSRYGDNIMFLYRGILMELVKKREYKNKIPEALYLVEELIKKYPKNFFLKKDFEILQKKKSS